MCSCPAAMASSCGHAGSGTWPARVPPFRPWRRQGPQPTLTSAVGVVTGPRRVVPTQPAQQQAVVHQPLDGLQQERVKRQVADFLELELFVYRL